MDIKVTVEFKNEFDTMCIGHSESKNIDVDSHYELIVTHVKQAIIAVGFTAEQVDDMFYLEKYADMS